MTLTDSDGVSAVRVARVVIDAECAGMGSNPDIPDSFSIMRGVFVTVSEYPSMNLRGCIGFPEPVFLLKDALVRAAVSVCHDPRFEPLTSVEARNCVVEVTVLTSPKELSFKDYSEMLSMIELGRDGVIMEYMGHRALFLPQVASEQGWDKFQMFEALSYKAGLDRKAWKNKGVRIWAFGGEVFSEIMPYGDVVRKG